MNFENVGFAAKRLVNTLDEPIVVGDVLESDCLLRLESGRNRLHQ